MRYNSGMKLCRAAALALVGWYLMIPPTSFKAGTATVDHQDDKAPLSQWVMLSAYDTVAACQEIVVAEVTHGGAPYYGRAQCIASDDPRLKAK